MLLGIGGLRADGFEPLDLGSESFGIKGDVGATGRKSLQPAPGFFEVFRAQRAQQDVHGLLVRSRLEHVAQLGDRLGARGFQGQLHGAVADAIKRGAQFANARKTGGLQGKADGLVIRCIDGRVQRLRIGQAGGFQRQGQGFALGRIEHLEHFGCPRQTHRIESDFGIGGLADRFEVLACFVQRLETRGIEHQFRLCGIVHGSFVQDRSRCLIRIHRIECRLLGALVAGSQGALQLARQFLSSSFAFGQGFAPTLFGRIGLHDFRRDVGGHVLDGLKHRDAFAQTLFELRQFLRAEIGECFLQPLDAFARGFDFLADAVDDGRLVFGAGDRLRTGSVAIGHAGRFADDAFLSACGLIDLVALAHGVGQEFSRCDYGQSDAGRDQGGFDADRGGARCGHHSGEGGAGGGAQGHECCAGTGHACGHGGHGGGKLRGGCDHRLADAELEGHRGGAHADKDRQKRAQAGHQLDQC